MFKDEKQNISWRVSKQRLSPSSPQRLQPPWVIAATSEGEPLSPEGTQAGTTICPLAAIRLQLPPRVSSKGAQEVKNTGY